ncbi:MAG: MFS transporter [Bacteroidota bacterium]|jgi:MFS family permease|nr:MAG: MFS transporter [Bacteroidota bacterium]
MNPSVRRHLFSTPVIVAALGYMVDIYDLLLFGIVRIPSLKGIGVPDAEVLDQGIRLINFQMVGLLLGGIIWGIFGDRKGRKSVLFGSILLYSIANIANGFVTDVNQYAVIRFLAGIGLAGELGAGITLVAEILPKEVRGYGTALVATVGMFGAVLAYFIAEAFDWRVAYFIGGGLGILLLIMRIGVFESGLFAKLKQTDASRGNFLLLFTNLRRFKKYMGCILIGMPTWYVVGILVILSPELGTALGIAEGVVAGKAVMFTYVGLAIGDMASGLISQWMKSRKKVVRLFILLTGLMVVLYVYAPIRSTEFLYFMCVMLGISVGYWALFVTIAAEQFGTNLRATVTTTVPNFIRGTLPMLNFFFVEAKDQWGILNAALVVGIGTIVVALGALSLLAETFHNDLDYIEP